MPKNHDAVLGYGMMTDHIVFHYQHSLNSVSRAAPSLPRSANEIRLVWSSYLTQLCSVLKPADSITTIALRVSTRKVESLSTPRPKFDRIIIYFDYHNFLKKMNNNKVF